VGDVRDTAVVMSVLHIGVLDCTPKLGQNQQFRSKGHVFMINCI